jgi:hypothetical protein
MDYIEKLNKEQQDIILNKDFKKSKTAMCIIACAGSGKTTTIISKIVYMCNKLKCKPEHFFITTFTKNACNELKKRLEKYLDKKSIDLMTIGTFHSISYTHVIGYQQNNNIIDDHIEQYLYDFYDLLNNKKFKKKYYYIFIDEYQDINLIQENIITRLYNKKESKLLLTVGDDQQNIYTFRKTDINYILDFTKKYENGRYYFLNKNYRSQENIITLANIILKYNKKKITPEQLNNELNNESNNEFNKMICMNNNIIKRKIKIINFNSIEEQCNEIVNIIKKNIYNENIKLNNIAIIARNNFSLQNIECLLANQNIPSIFLDSIIENINFNNRIILSTIHGTKGLEFDNVFIIDLNYNIFPSSLCNDIEEERRLFYVAITRAKNNLILCYTKDNPSLFLNEIIDDRKSNDIIIKNCIIKENIIKERIIKRNYNLLELIRRLEIKDYNKIKEIFDYTRWEIKEEKINNKISDNNFFKNNLILSNIGMIFYDFIKTFIFRSILLYNKKEIECLDYIFISLYEIKYNLKILKNEIGKKWVDKKYGTKLLNRDDEYINNIINYIDKHNDIKNKIDNINIEKYKNAYINYCSNISSNEIIFDIFIISTIKSILRGRKSFQYLINFSDSYNIHKINISDLVFYKNWFDDIFNSCSLFISSNIFNIQLNIRDPKTKIKCIIDLIIDDSIIEIRTSNDNKVTIEIIIKLLCYVGICRNNGYIINYIKLYNPLNGLLLTWDIKLWDLHNDLLNIIVSYLEK